MGLETRFTFVLNIGVEPLHYMFSVNGNPKIGFKPDGGSFSVHDTNLTNLLRSAIDQYHVVVMRDMLIKFFRKSGAEADCFDRLAS